MKWLTFILLLANIVFFAFMQFGGAREGKLLYGHEPFRAAEVNILPAQKASPTAPQPASSRSAQNTPAVEKTVCLQWGSFNTEEANRAQRVLDKLQLGSRVAAQKIEEAARYWAHIPPSSSKAEAQKKVDAIKALGVRDSFVMQENNKWIYAISLGIFKTEESAAKHLAQLREKGVRDAKIGAYDLTQKTNFLINNVNEGTAAELGRLKQNFPGSDLRPVDCPVVNSATAAQPLSAGAGGSRGGP